MELHLEQIPDLRPSGCLHKTPARKVLRRFAILLHCQTREEQREREREMGVGSGERCVGVGEGATIVEWSSLGPVVFAREQEGDYHWELLHKLFVAAAWHGR